MRHAVLDPVLESTPAPAPDLPGCAPTAVRARELAGTAAGAVAFDEAGLRDFYDPAGLRRDRPVGVLLADAAATRVPFVLPPVGRLSGYEVVLVEALHAGLDRPTGVRGRGRAGSVVLPVPTGRQRAVAAAVDRYAGTVAAAVLEVADDLGGDLSHLYGRAPGRSRPAGSRRVLHAGSVLAAVAHDGAVRRSGRPFWCHPHEVATILALAWRRRAGEPDLRLGTSQFLAYCHDAYEDALDPVGGYLSARPVVVSPLVARAVLQRLAVPDAAEVARVLLLMTRTRATDGSRMPYLSYVDRGIAAGGPHFTMVKSADIHHNLTVEPDRVDPDDPRAPARHAKRETYRTAAARLRDAADGHDERTARTTHAVFAVRRADLPAPIGTGSSLGRLASAVHRRAGRL